MAKKNKAYYAIMEGKRLSIFDYRLPIYWKRALAVRDMKEKCFDNARVVRVNVREE